MKSLLIATVLIASLLALGCIGQVTGDAKAQCTQQLSACQSNCDNHGYVLAGDIEACKNRCSTDYNTCVSH